MKPKRSGYKTAAQSRRMKEYAQRERALPANVATLKRTANAR